MSALLWLLVTNSDSEESGVSHLAPPVTIRTYAQAVLGTEPVVDSKNESTPENTGPPSVLLETNPEVTDHQWSGI